MKQKAPQLSEGFIERNVVFTLCAGPTRLELATSGLTGRRSNQLNYDPISSELDLYINESGINII